MRHFATLLVSACLVGLPASAMAQGEDDEEEALGDVGPAEGEGDDEGEGAATGGEGEGEAAAPEGAAAPAARATTDEAFDIRHGFFAEGDLGVFLTFGGTNTNNPNLPKRATSNIQPSFAMVVGYDVVHNDSFNLGVGLRFGMLLNGGAGRVTNEDIGGGVIEATTKPNDFNIIETGLALQASIMMTPRLALSIKGGGGLAMLDPDPTKAASTSTGDPLGDAGGIGIGGIFGVGAGIEYFTLLNGFSVGLHLRFVGVLMDGFIPAAAITIPVKYNF